MKSLINKVLQRFLGITVLFKIMPAISFLIITIFTLIWIFKAPGWVIFSFIFFIVFFLVFVVYWSVASEKKNAEERLIRQKENEDKIETEQAAARDAVVELVEQHKITLSRRSIQTIYKDDYGNLIYDNWNKEVDYFIEAVLCREIPDLRSLVSEMWIRELITNFAVNSCENTEDHSIGVLPDNMTPVEFEHFCASLLEADGWDVRVTPMSGDQGVDIIGQLGELKAVFQCKLYSSPVGNSAVQEIIAGKHYEQADLAVVITNSTYTRSARSLASTANVLLLHFTELPGLIRRLP